MISRVIVYRVEKVLDYSGEEVVEHREVHGQAVFLTQPYEPDPYRARKVSDTLGASQQIESRSLVKPSGSLYHFPHEHQRQHYMEQDLILLTINRTFKSFAYTSQFEHGGQRRKGTSSPMILVIGGLHQG